MPERCERRESRAVARESERRRSFLCERRRRRLPSAMREQLQKERTHA